jgi:hypothetical protein
MVILRRICSLSSPDAAFAIPKIASRLFFLSSSLLLGFTASPLWTRRRRHEQEPNEIGQTRRALLVG